jgi:hypothetical protein
MQSSSIFFVPIVAFSYNPFGRPGAGAPLRDNSGRIIAVLIALFFNLTCDIKLQSHFARPAIAVYTNSRTFVELESQGVLIETGLPILLMISVSKVSTLNLKTDMTNLI